MPECFPEPELATVASELDFGTRETAYAQLQHIEQSLDEEFRAILFWIPEV